MALDCALLLQVELIRAPPNRLAPPAEMQRDSSMPSGGARTADPAAGYGYAGRTDSAGGAALHGPYRAEPAAGYRDSMAAPSPQPMYSELPPADAPQRPAYYAQASGAGPPIRHRRATAAGGLGDRRRLARRTHLSLVRRNLRSSARRWLQAHAGRRRTLVLMTRMRMTSARRWAQAHMMRSAYALS